MKRLFLTLVTAIVFLASSMPSSLAADTSAPLLVDWTLQTSSADISNSSRTVTVKFILSDDSRINEPKLLVKSLPTTQLSAFAQVKEVARAGKLVSYEATATINVGQAPREWEWVLYPLSDELGNSNNSFGPGGVWPVKLQVFDKSYTASNYSLVRLCLSTLRIFNQRFSSFLKIQEKDPSDVRLSVIKLKFLLPENLIDEKLCETDTEKTYTNYGLDASEGLGNALSPIYEEMDFKAAQATRDKAAKEIAAREAARAAAAKATPRNITITCIKGKLTKKISATKPRCPSGYKVKK